MLLIPCPWCGEREETEFRCGGEAHIARPAKPAAVSDADWADYLFMRRNPKGLHRERWRHVHGCGRWFNLARDTVTDQVLAVYEMGAARPEIDRPQPPAPPSRRQSLTVVGSGDEPGR